MMHLQPRRRVGLWATITLLTLSVARFGFATQPALTADDVNRLIIQLADDRAASRRDAEQQLLAAGPPVLQWLPDPIELPDAAARDALQRIRRELERIAADAEVLPSRITFAGAASLTQLVAEMERQTGNRVRLDAHVDAQRRLSIDWQARTFWQAVDELASETELQMSFNQETGDILLVAPAAAPASDNPRPVVIKSAPESAYWITISPTHPPKSANARRGLTSVRVEVHAEPRLRPLFLAVRDADFVMATAQGPWSHFNPLASREIEFTAAGSAAFDVLYQREPAEEFDGLRASGQFDVELIGRAEELRLTGLDGRLPIVRRRGDVTVSLDALRGEGAAGIAAQLTLRYIAGGPAFESHRVASLFRDACLELPGGERLVADPVAEFTREENGVLGATYRFPAPPATWRQGTLIYAAPTILTRQSVTFRSSTGE